MTLNEVKQFVLEKNKKIFSENYPDEGYTYCKCFLEDIDYSSLDQFVANLLYFDFFAFAKCLFYINTKDKNTIDDSCQLFDTIVECLKYIAEEDENSFLENLLQISVFSEHDFFAKYIQEKSSIKANYLLSKYNFVNSEFDNQEDIDYENETIKEFLSLLRHFYLEKNLDVISVVNNIHENEYLMSGIMKLLQLRDLIRKTGLMYIAATDQCSSKQKKKLSKDLFNVDDLQYIYKGINFIKKFIADEDSRRNKIDKEINLNNQVLDTLSREAKKDEILDARNIIRKIKDDEIKNIILRYIYSHNKLYYDELNKNLEKYRGKYAFAYYEELTKIGIVVDKEELNDFISCDFEEFKEMIQIIKKYGLSDFEFKKILKISKIDIVKRIDSYIKDGLLNVSFVMRNIDIYDSSNKKINIIEKNVTLLNSYGINPRLFIDCLDILLYDGSQLEYNLNILVDYGLKGFLKTTNNYYFLLDDDLVSKIDKFIELGYIDYIEKDMSLLNSNNLKRLDLLKSMNMPLSKLDELRKVLSDDSFIVSDSSLDNYIFNSLDNKNKKRLSLKIDNLESYRINKRAYSINGVIISSNKVKRLINNGYDLYDAITYGLILSDNDYELLFDGKVFTLS